jgi:hypothetical protein
MPKEPPWPFGVAVRVPLAPETLAYQESWRLWPLPVLVVATQTLLPERAKLVMNRSPEESPAVTVTCVTWSSMAVRSDDPSMFCIQPAAESAARERGRGLLAVLKLPRCGYIRGRRWLPAEKVVEIGGSGIRHFAIVFEP